MTDKTFNIIINTCVNHWSSTAAERQQNINNETKHVHDIMLHVDVGKSYFAYATQTYYVYV